MTVCVYRMTLYAQVLLNDCPRVQVLLNQLEFGMNPQRALDQPRVCLGSGYGCVYT